MNPQFITIPDALRYRKLTVTPLQTAYDLCPISFQSLDKNGYIFDVNKHWLEILGYEREDVIHTWFGNYLAPTSQETFKVNFPKFCEAGEVRNVEFEMIQKNGSTIFVSYNGRVEFDEYGSFVKTHCYFMNVTDRVKKEKELEELNKMMIDRELKMVELKNEIERLKHPQTATDTEY